MASDASARKFPLSLSQLNILNLERVLPGTSVNNISTTVRITGRLDFPVLQQSIRLVIESDSSLRIRLAEENGTVLQYHAPYEPETFPVYDFSNTSKEGIENWESAVTHELIPLFGGPLYRFVLFRDSENSGGVLVKLHHIIADGWSQIMLCNKIGRTYLDLLTGKEPDLPIAPDYELHVIEEQEYLESKAYKKDEKYWQEVISLAGEPSVLKSVNSAAVSPVGRRLSFEFPEILNHAIYTYCLKNRVAPFAVLYMALAIYFKRNGGAENFTIGVPIFNRTNYEFKQSTGMFVTTLPFCSEINDEWTFDRFNEELTERWFDMLRHQRYPFSKICELSGKEGRLFNIALSYQDSKIYESPDASVMFSGRWHYCGYQAEQLTIHLTNLKNHRQYAVDYDYLAQFFTESEITELHKNLCHILSEALSEPDRPIYRLNILSLEQKEELLYEFNKTDRPLEERSVYRALLDNNARHLNRVALIQNGERMTYGALFHRSMQVALELFSRGIGEGDLVAVLLPRGFDLYAAMVGAVQMDSAYMILSGSLPDERIKNILSQSGAAALVTYSNNMRFAECGIPVICVDEINIAELPLFIEKTKSDSDTLPGDRLAYVVYTSGSTGEPKGVEITQRNLLNLAQEMEKVYGQGAVLSVCNVGFDAFMLESIVALLSGRTIVLPSDSDLESPEQLSMLMNSYAVDFFAITPSRLSAFMQNNVFRKVMWRMESIVCGGEPFPPELLKKLKVYTKARIYNQYGPSEATVAVSMKEISKSDKITIGKPMGNCKLYVLDQWMNPLPIGGNGRLFVGGKCVGRGYRNRPELTEAAFRQNPFINDDRIYDTGDMAYWTPGGEIVLTGRADRQVKLRGLRIELQEISSCVETYPGVSRAFARVCKVRENEVIGVYYSSDREIGDYELFSHTATYLPDYMIPAFFMRVSAFYTTANGKVDESRLPMPKAEAGAACYDVSLTAKRITEIFREVLHTDKLNASSDYFLNGGNSLNSLETIIKIEEAFGTKIRVSDLYACRNAVRIAELIDGRSYSSGVGPQSFASVRALKKAPLSDKYPLTPVQKGIYVQSVLDPSGLSYNMPGAFMLEKKPDEKRLSNAFKALIASDAIFRTSFIQDNCGVSAVVHGSVDFDLEMINADSLDGAEAEFLRPFDLSSAPLLRGGLWHSPENDKWYLFVDSHHIIGDGMSTPVILQRLDSAYRGNTLSVEWDYYDYVHTDANSDSDEKKASLSYWVDHLKKLPDALDLPTDFTRPKKFDYKGENIELDISETDSKAIRSFCLEHGYSEYVVFLAAYGLLLSALSGRDDIIIGAPIAGRTYSECAEICGPFINTLPLRLAPKKDITADEWLKNVQTEVAGMLDNQGVGLEDIISALGLQRGEQNALYRVMMSQSPVDEDKFVLDGGKMTFSAVPTGSAKMDMTLELAQKSGCYVLRISYATSLFEHDTVSFYSRCIENIVKELIKNTQKRIDTISMLSPADREKMIDIPNYRVTPFVNRPLHHIIRSKALVSPDDVAIIFHGEEITYSRLEKRASAIAQFIEDEGVMPGQCVGICLERTPDIIAAMYGVLKAGCCYMLMLASFPTARLNYMLGISNAPIILCDSLSEDMISPEISCRVCRLPDGEIDGYSDRPVKDTDLFNVHFTSGSTGKPKGVMICHRSMSNLYAMVKDLVEPYSGRFLCSTQTVFDCFVVETLVAIAIGRTVVFADEEEMMLPWKLAQLMETYDTGLFEMTPSRLWLYFGNEAFCRAARKIKLLMVGGEVLTKPLLDKFYQHSEGTLLNMYGPSETTVYTTMGIIRPDEHITIGTPVMNTRVYVVDEDLNPVLPTAVGELCVAGESLSVGYISAPELTEKSFVEDISFPQSKMYRSGDLVRMRVDGSFDYVGRKDSQVKLNGQRIELTEITGAIEQTGCVDQAATVAIRTEDGSMELCSFYSSSAEEDKKNEIIAGISAILPDYMIPSRVIRLSSLPVTATNKIDLRALQEMASKAPSSDASKKPPASVKNSEKSDQASPVTPNEEYVLSVWNRVLSEPATELDVSFFDNGGTSMGALSVLSYYYNDGLEMSLSDFYENVTVSAQAELLSKKRAASCDASPMSESIENCENKTERLPLITGATGFFGIHLTKELTDTESGRILCLVRDGSAARVRELLDWYFGENEAERIFDRIEIIKGDITADRLGMTDEEYDELALRVGEIYHTAADVRHYASNAQSYMDTNVKGTENMLALARRAGAAFYHMSTASVSGSGMKKGYVSASFTENDYDVGQIWENNIYVKSKFLAEGLVLDAAKEGMKVKIFRLGRLVGRMSDGKFQFNPSTNVFYLLLKGILQLGAIPEEAAAVKTDIMPIDLCAKEVVALRNGESSIYHIMNFDPPTLGEIISVIDGEIRIVDKVTFGKIFREKLSKIDRELITVIFSNLNEDTSRIPGAKVTWDITASHLEKAGFSVPEIPMKTVLKSFGKGEQP